MNNSTIAAIATPFGAGGIGTIRVSGDNAKEIVSKVFKGKKDIKSLGDYCGCYGHAYDDDGVIDEVIILNFNAPKSYTGEDVVEVSSHGGIVILQRLLRAIVNNGANLAEKGEFTKRAFLNEKVTLTQAEAVMDLITASSKQAAQAAISLKQGELFKTISKITKQLVIIQGHITAWIDFPEEDVEDVSSDEVLELIKIEKEKLKNLIDNYSKGQIIKNGVKTAIVGKPNVGKSTLMNLLSGEEKSIVTDIAGTTRDIVEETINLNNITLRIADTAGIRETDDPIEKIGVEMAKKKISESQIILAVFDNSSEIDEQDIEILTYLKDKPFIAIINKTDLEDKLDLKKIYSFIDEEKVVFISAKNKEGINKLEKTVEKILNVENIDPSAAFLANERQRECANSALSNLSEAIFAVENGITFDAVSVCIENSIENLLTLTGEKASELIIDEVFSKFCVGK